MIHPYVQEVSVRMSLGQAEAEQYLRATVASDPKAAAAVAEIDGQRKAASDAGRAWNQECARDLGLSWEKAAALTELLADRPDLLTWLSKRVHLAIAHDRPLRDDE